MAGSKEKPPSPKQDAGGAGFQPVQAFRITSIPILFMNSVHLGKKT
jgi:hypothetical protein